jgi:gamma-glutamyltranspeptidase/glutathione hydrolase
MRGIVVCVDPRAAEEGAKVLEAGGSAFDAAVATAFVQMITLPYSCGVAGMMTANLFAPHAGGHLVIDGCLRAGSLTSEDMWTEGYLGEAAVSGTSLFEDRRSTMGYTSICTPGTVAVLGEMQARYCTMPWNDLLQPAIGVAKQGITVGPDLRTSMTTPSLSPHEPDAFTRITANAPSSAIFLTPEGEAPLEGAVIRNPDYANTLERLAASGPGDLYHGELAGAIADDLQRNGSFVTAADLADYRPTEYAPLSTTYRDYRVYTNSAPGAGPLLIEALNVVGGLGVDSMIHGGVEHMSNLAPTLQLVNQDRIDYLGDPEVIGQAPLELLLSEARADEVRAAVRDGVVGGRMPPGEEADTTHLTVVDADGNVASITHSLGNISGVITPGLGFMYNNGMNRFDPRPGRASSIAPRKARLHLMMPSMAFKDDNLAMAFGAPGGNAILSALTQVFTNVVDFGMSAVEAVSAPRIHAEGDIVWCESRARTEVVEALRNRGHNVFRDPASLARGLARAQMVIVGPDGELDGGSDPRGPMGVARSER